MPHERFEELRERLLRAGIAPRHVRRYISELRDHFADLVREEMKAGATQDGAAQAAHARIGSDNDLSAVMLARPELRSVTARFPWAVFGIAPVPMLVITIVAAVLMEGLFLYLAGLWGETLPATPPDWVKFLVFQWNLLVTYVAAPMIAALLCVLGVRQRMSTQWIMFGAALVCIVGAFHLVDATWGDLGVGRPEISVTLALAPPFPQWLINEGLLRAAINLALVSVSYWLWLRRTSGRVTE